ncbi:MAG: hypothetical protein ABSD57_00165 [Verrucomicrobiota bacterium]
MLLNILFFFIEFGVQTVFLTVALWIMIKLQKLDYNFPGLLGSAALACGLDTILNLILGRWFGPFSVYISAPVFVVVLFVCIRKVTQADQVDVIFTICVGGALRFGMNLWLIGALMGDLRPSAGAPEEFETVTQQPPQPQLQATNKVSQTAIKTNQPVQNTQPPAPSASTNSAVQKGPAKPVEAATNLFSVKGVSQNASKSAVTIQTGKRTYTISLGESALTQTSDGLVSVRFKELGDGWVVLTINGKETKLLFH